MRRRFVVIFLPKVNTIHLIQGYNDVLDTVEVGNRQVSLDLP
jgi:hypothetical protein